MITIKFKWAFDCVHLKNTSILGKNLKTPKQAIFFTVRLHLMGLGVRVNLSPHNYICRLLEESLDMWTLHEELTSLQRIPLDQGIYVHILCIHIVYTSGPWCSPNFTVVCTFFLLYSLNWSVTLVQRERSH